MINIFSTKLNRIISLSILTLIYSIALFFTRMGRPFKRTHPLPQRRILINGTFHNPNWFFAHIEPIVRSNYGEVILVCDEPVANLPGLRYVCPPRWAAKVFSRAGAKFLWSLFFGLRHGTDLFMGYHIFPSAITALICARLLGANAVYQVTSGSLELEGGGWNAENRLLVALGRPSAWIEYLAFAVTRSFDLVIVRGNTAAEFIRNRAKYQHYLEIITGSIDIKNNDTSKFRDIDVIFVGRLTECKRPDRLIKALSLVIDNIPSLNAVFVGDGPDLTDLKTQTHQLGLANHITFLGQRTDVPELLERARVFVLTSRSESVSIAMLEAMALRVVPVVSDVGDLASFVENDVTGFILPGDDITGFSERISRLLSNESLRTQLAKNACDRVISSCDRTILAQRWKQVLVKTTTKTTTGHKEKI